MDQIRADEVLRNQRRAREQAEQEAIERMQTLQARMNYEAELQEKERKRKQYVLFGSCDKKSTARSTD